MSKHLRRENQSMNERGKIRGTANPAGNERQPEKRIQNTDGEKPID